MGCQLKFDFMDQVADNIFIPGNQTRSLVPSESKCHLFSLKKLFPIFPVSFVYPLAHHKISTLFFAKKCDLTFLNFHSTEYFILPLSGTNLMGLSSNHEKAHQHCMKYVIFGLRVVHGELINLDIFWKFFTMFPLLS